MAKYKRREFRVGEFYLSQRSGSPAWFRTWFDEKTSQTRRVSLKTNDFELAKDILLDWYNEERMRSAQNLSTDEVKLKDVFSEYLENHSSTLVSYPAHKILLRYWQEFYVDGLVSDVRDIRQQELFREFLLVKKKLAPNSANRCLEIGRASLNRAFRRNIITSAPYIHTFKVDNEKPRGRPLSPEEVGRLYTHSADHVRLFIILMLGTGARNEAITTLEWPQVDFEADLIQLNPLGRTQTSKRRPVVKLVPFVKELLTPMKQAEGRIITFRGKDVGKVIQGIRKSVERAKLDREVTAYSLRHTVARWLRKEGVTPWETAQQLGHKFASFNMTERYASWAPDYLVNAAPALDKLLRASIPLNAPPIINGR